MRTTAPPATRALSRPTRTLTATGATATARIRTETRYRGRSGPGRPVRRLSWGQGTSSGSPPGNAPIATDRVAGVPRHPASEYGPAHTTSTAGCTDCHDPSLIAEHAKYPTTGAFKNQCSTCHTSTSAEVQQAIATWNTACEACHPTTSHYRPARDSTLPASCEGCHEPNLARPARRSGCPSCHSSADGDVIAAIAVGNTACDACHGRTAASGGHDVAPRVHPAWTAALHAMALPATPS